MKMGQRAVSLTTLGKLEEAEAIYREMIAIGTTNQAVFGNLAAVCGMQGRSEEVIELLNKAIDLKHDYPDAHNNLGVALQKKGDINAAIDSFNTALKLKPNYPVAHYNLGTALQEQGELTAAIASFNKAIELKPDYADAHNNLGTALQKTGNLTTAISYYNTCIRLNPDYPDAYINLGNALQEQGELTAAIASFNKAIELKPDCPNALFNSSLTMLLGGDYRNGWERYEWRMKKEKDPVTPNAIPSCDRWSGEDEFKDANLLIVTEQGLGDTFQFMRYANAMRQQGAKISFCAQPKLHSLIQASGIDESPLTPNQGNQVINGQWIPLLSLPKYLGVNPYNPIITEPYICTTDDLFVKWQTILSAEQQPIIGINWQGNPLAEQSALRGRSLALETLAPIATQTNAKLLSLQKGFGSEQLETCSFKKHFVNCQDQVNEIWDFLETAAIIANCDLIVTSDTAVAHLAGGMGKSTWLLLQNIPDWRWGLEGDSTFWYPTMRLFRQREKGNWDEVIRRVALALQEQFGNTSLTS